MPEYKTPQTAEEFDQNFAQIHPLMNPTEAYYESSRCLFCYDAPCVHACPTGIDIPLFIRQINSGNLSGSARTIYEANYFGYACGKVCPTEVLCEGACVYKFQDVKPIEIGRLQSFATVSVMESGEALFGLAPDNGKRVAIVGAGPAGISCACELRTLGYTVSIFEGRAKPSGLTVHGVAPYKITNEEVLAEVDYLQNQFGFDITYNSWIDSATLGDLGEEYDAVFIGVGLGPTTRVDIPGSDLPGCLGAVEFIEELRDGQAGTKVGDNVVVIGGGNTAMDAASETARMGAGSVSLVYRRSFDSMRAYHFEYDLAKQAGVSGVFNARPLSIEGGSAVSSVRFIGTQESNGELRDVPGSEFALPADMVIFATGQTKQIDLLTNVDGLQTDRSGRITVNEIGQTGNPAYFAGGDAINGGKEVVNAAADGKLAARGIHSYLSQHSDSGE